MSRERRNGDHGDLSVRDVPPMRDLAFSMLSVLIEAAAGQLRVDLPAADLTKAADSGAAPDLREARAAIDAANALLGSVRTVMENDALLAIEGTLTQLQIEYVRLVSRSA
jgi:hypothetical protein